jgi:hypothetical protein
VLASTLNVLTACVKNNTPPKIAIATRYFLVFILKGFRLINNPKVNKDCSEEYH